MFRILSRIKKLRKQKPFGQVAELMRESDSGTLEIAPEDMDKRENFKHAIESVARLQDQAEETRAADEAERHGPNVVPMVKPSVHS